ncbi:hypothetical protein V6N12_040392 [Hibiscus sabdariffa]|uniref:DUF659 domain-containing protein n=1 Tax=Hibiscus sabdariffa TaxID=183260 RepID=A0ABR2E4Z3_9ROSI
MLTESKLSLHWETANKFPNLDKPDIPSRMHNPGYLLLKQSEANELNQRFIGAPKVTKMVEHKQSFPEPPTTQDLSLVIHGVGTDYMEAKEMNPGEALMFDEMFLTNGKEVSTQIPILDQVDASTILQKSFIRNESIPQFILRNRQKSYEQLEMDGIHVPRFLKVFELKNVHMSVRRFLFDIGATLDAVNSVYFQPMGDAIISGRNMSFMPPCNDLQGWILKKSMEMVKSDDEKLITSCVRISCYNLANRWNIQPCRILLHFLVYCAKGVLSKSIYTSTVINSSDDLYEILKQVVEEVRFKLGLQVITNCDEQCTRRRLAETFPALNWTLRAAHWRPQFGQSKGRTKADEPVPSEKRITYFCLSLWTTAGNEIDGVYKVAILNRNTPFLLVLFWKKLPQLAETSIERVEKNSYILSNSSYRNNLDEIVLVTEFELEIANVYLKLQHTSFALRRDLKLLARTEKLKTKGRRLENDFVSFHFEGQKKKGAVTSLYWSSASELGFRFSLPFLNDLYEGFFLDITLNLRLLF